MLLPLLKRFFWNSFVSDFGPVACAVHYLTLCNVTFFHEVWSCTNFHISNSVIDMQSKLHFALLFAFLFPFVALLLSYLLSLMQTKSYVQLSHFILATQTQAHTFASRQADVTQSLKTSALLSTLLHFISLQKPACQQRGGKKCTKHPPLPEFISYISSQHSLFTYNPPDY